MWKKNLLNGASALNEILTRTGNMYEENVLEKQYLCVKIEKKPKLKRYEYNGITEYVRRKK
jgi:hypothetical protein